MTQFEFTERTKVQVTPEEYWSINDVYNNSDLDKDEFCKQWCKMNSSRVKYAKERAAQKQAKEKIFNALSKIAYKYYSPKQLEMNAFDFFSLRQIELIEENIGFSCLYGNTNLWLAIFRIKNWLHLNCSTL